MWRKTLSLPESCLPANALPVPSSYRQSFRICRHSYHQEEADLLDIHHWINEKKCHQSVRAIFSDCWYFAYGCQCRSNQVDLDAIHYEVRHEVPVYVYSSYLRKERRCSIH